MMANERTDRVGCAAVLYKSNNVMVICDYSGNNFYGKPVYTVGPTASKCQTGKNSQYLNLCSKAERIGYNPWA